MKKNLTRILSLVLVVLMVLPLGVFANDTYTIAADKYHDGGSDIVIYDGGTKNSVQLSVAGADVLTWYTNTAGKEFIDVSSDGVVTAKTLATSEPKTATIYAALDNDKGTVTATITVKKYKVTNIEIQSGTKTSYVNGQTIKKSDIVVDATYSDSTVVKGISDFIFSPEGPLTVDNKTLTVTYSKDTNLADTVEIVVADVNLKDFVESISISSPTSGKEYYVGDILKPSDIQIKIKNVGSNTYTYATAAQNSDITVSVTIGNTTKTWTTDGYTFSSNDVTSATKKCTVTVTYAGKSATTELTVKNKGTTTSRYTATLLLAPTKKTYAVGDKFSISGASFTVKHDNVAIAGTYLSDFAISYTFTSADVGKTSFDFDLTFKHNGTYQTCKVTIGGLTVAAAETYVDEVATQILMVSLKQEKYPIGYTFSLKDIDYVWGRFKETTAAAGNATLKTVTGDQLLKYTAYLKGEIDLEVLDKNGNRKSSYKANKLSESDVVNNEATLLFYFGQIQCEVIVDVGEPDISYIYSDTLIAEYIDIEDTLEYTKEQDPKVDVSVFDLSKVSAPITIKLGRDYKLPTNYVFNPTKNVEIDLNGNTLTMDSDQIEVLRANRTCTVTVINTSATEATLVYDEKDITIVLQKNEYVEFAYNKEVPGFVYITINKVNNGKVTADYDIVDSQIELGYGSDVKFTITPNSGYVIDSIKVDTKVISANDYTVATNGTVTYVLEDVKDDATLYVTFKTGTSADDWTNPWSNYTTNPFRDVSKTSNYYTAVRFVYTNGLFQGTETNKFEPNTTMTRAMFVTVLGRLAEETGIKVTRYTNSSYTDVVVNKDTNWYTPYVEWATRNGIVEGHGDGTFGPDEKITHEQMYVIMYRYAMFIAKKSVGNVSTVSITSITDRTSISDWALDAVKYAHKNGFIIYPTTGSSKIVPQGEAKRSELAMLLEKYCEIILDWENLEK